MGKVLFQVQMFRARLWFKMLINGNLRGADEIFYDLSSKEMNSLVIEDDVGPPDVIGGNMEHVDSTVFGGIPSHFIVVPELLHPQICGHDLIP